MGAARQLYDMKRKVCRANFRWRDLKWRSVRHNIFWDTFGFVMCRFIGHDKWIPEDEHLWACKRCTVRERRPFTDQIRVHAASVSYDASAHILSPEYEQYAKRNLAHELVDTMLKDDAIIFEEWPEQDRMTRRIVAKVRTI